MQEKLEHKSYANAMQYYNLEKYLDGEALKAAIIAFDNFQTDYPDSKYNENVSFLKIECAYKMAKEYQEQTGRKAAGSHYLLLLFYRQISTKCQDQGCRKSF